MADTLFSLDLNEDQRELQKWLHEFAAEVIRPVAADYDARQEFPWPVLEEAAERGFYSPLFYRDLIGDPTGLSLPMFMEELFWGARGSAWRSGAARCSTAPRSPRCSSAGRAPC